LIQATLFRAERGSGTKAEGNVMMGPEPYDRPTNSPPEPAGDRRRFPAWPLEAILAIILLVLCGMIRVQQCARWTTRGYRLAAYREQIQQLDEEIHKLEYEYATLVTGENLAARVRAFHLPLVPPEEARGRQP